MPQDTTNIALPEAMKRFVQERVGEGAYGSLSEYVYEVICADRRRKAEERIDAFLIEGLDPGTSLSVPDDYWEEEERRLTERLGQALKP